MNAACRLIPTTAIHRVLRRTVPGRRRRCELRARQLVCRRRARRDPGERLQETIWIEWDDSLEIAVTRAAGS